MFERFFSSTRVISEIKVEDPVEVGSRTFYIVIKLSFLETANYRIVGGWIEPLAMLVIESGMQYVISLSGDEISLDGIVKLAPSLKEMIYNKSH